MAYPKPVVLEALTTCEQFGQSWSGVRSCFCFNPINWKKRETASLVMTDSNRRGFWTERTTRHGKANEREDTCTASSKPFPVKLELFAQIKKDCRFVFHHMFEKSEQGFQEVVRARHTI